MFERFTDRARRVVVLAQEEARMLKHNYIGTEHILLGLIHEGEGVAAKALESLGISLEAVRQQVEEIIGEGQQAPSGHIPFTPRAKKVLELSLREALQLGHNYIGTEHILLGLIREGGGVAAQVLVKLGADLNRVRQQVILVLPDSPVKERPPEPETSAVLDRFGRNLVVQAWDGRLRPVVGRERELERVVQVLGRRAQGNPLLIGVPGAGKTTIADGVAGLIADGRATALSRRLVYAIDERIVDIPVSADGPDELAKRLKAIAAEVRTRGDLILFLDGAQLLAAFKDIITAPAYRADAHVIGAVTPGDWDVLRAADPQWAGFFVPIAVAEVTTEETVEILKAWRDRYEAHHRVVIEDEALAAAAELAGQWMPDRLQPGKAMDLIDEAASLCRIRNQDGPMALRKLDEGIAELRKVKELAIDGQDFEKASILREAEKQLIKERSEIERSITDGDFVPSVGRAMVTEALKAVLGPAFDEASGTGPATVPAPAVPLGDDLEIWGMA